MIVYTHATQDRVVIVESGGLNATAKGPLRFFRVAFFDADKGKITAELTIDDLRELVEAAELYVEKEG